MTPVNGTHPDTRRFLEVLFPEQIKPNDLEILMPSAPSTPGQVQLREAKIDEMDSSAPNSRPVYSVSGAKIGFVASADLMFPPCHYIYWLVEGAEVPASLVAEVG